MLDFFPVMWDKSLAVQSLLEVIDNALRERGISARRASLEATGTPDLIREMRRGVAPSAKRLRSLCETLGLEFYIGLPRGDLASISPEVEEATENLNRALRRAAEAADALSRLPARPKIDDIEHDSAPTEHTAEGEVIRFPATRQVAQIDLAVAAGGGAEAEGEAVTERLTFRLDWLKSHGLDPSQCTVVKVQGESMEPALPEGTAILVDRARRRRRVGGIFVVRTADGVVVKRAGKDEAGRWLLLSDHPAWEPAPWPADAEALGEVKWMARAL